MPLMWKAKVIGGSTTSAAHNDHGMPSNTPAKRPVCNVASSRYSVCIHRANNMCEAADALPVVCAVGREAGWDRVDRVAKSSG